MLNILILMLMEVDELLQHNNEPLVLVRQQQCNHQIHRQQLNEVILVVELQSKESIVVSPLKINIASPTSWTIVELLDLLFTWAATIDTNTRAKVRIIKKRIFVRRFVVVAFDLKSTEETFKLTLQIQKQLSSHFYLYCSISYFFTCGSRQE